MSTLSPQPKFTEKQGQYLAFIHAYTLVNGRPPAEADMERFFGVTPPSVHRMIVELEERGLIRRLPRQPRSIEVLLEMSVCSAACFLDRSKPLWKSTSVPKPIPITATPHLSTCSPGGRSNPGLVSPGCPKPLRRESSIYFDETAVRTMSAYANRAGSRWPVLLDGRGQHL